MRPNKPQLGRAGWLASRAPAPISLLLGAAHESAAKCGGWATRGGELEGVMDAAGPGSWLVPWRVLRSGGLQ